MCAVTHTHIWWNILFYVHGRQKPHSSIPHLQKKERKKWISENSFTTENKIMMIIKCTIQRSWYAISRMFKFFFLVRNVVLFLSSKIRSSESRHSHSCDFFVAHNFFLGNNISSKCYSLFHNYTFLVCIFQKLCKYKFLLHISGEKNQNLLK